MQASLAPEMDLIYQVLGFHQDLAVGTVEGTAALAAGMIGVAHFEHPWFAETWGLATRRALSVRPSAPNPTAAMVETSAAVEAVAVALLTARVSVLPTARLPLADFRSPWKVQLYLHVCGICVYVAMIYCCLRL